MNQKGIALVEVLAAMVILVMVVSLSFTILIQSRTQSKLNQDRLIAHQVGLMLSQYTFRYLSEESQYDALFAFIGDAPSKVLNQTSCSLNFSSSFCDFLFSVTINQTVYNDSRLVITVYEPVLGVIRLELTVFYASTRSVTHEVLLYE